jgi:hypothetical protein
MGRKELQKRAFKGNFLFFESSYFQQGITVLGTRFLVFQKDTF